ncbi:MAG: DUF4286 family protein [Phycisphaerales bacterium]|jgi:hypothetical protein|nr:DUF4286 family protein [Phycisphaerales bacterium]
MPDIAYTVTATLPDPRTRDEYVAWLREGHLAQVMKGGATTAAILLLTDPASPIRVQTRYTFSSPDALDRYLHDHAPALRADGLARFPPARGVAFAREIATILSHPGHVQDPSRP